MINSGLMLAGSPDMTLRKRAAQVIPGGMWGHQRAAEVPAGFPQFFASGRGARVTDVNGCEYIDFMCSWGPIILGHQHEAVEAAASKQWHQGDCLNGPTEHAVELAELLVHTIPMAEWALFQKNCGDATATCVMVARVGTKRRKILVANGSFHGLAPWSVPLLDGLANVDSEHFLFFDYNDTQSLARAVADAGDDFAGILVSALKHSLSSRLEEPTLEFARAVRGHCDRMGAALILDDVRSGFRLHLGGSWEHFGIRPDLAAYSKAIANGHPLAAVVGTERYREAASSIYTTGSFWYTGAPMAAAVATILELQHVDAPEVLLASGLRLRRGLAEQATRHGFSVTQSGPPSMPLMQFEDDYDDTLGEAFCLHALRYGVYMHHRHNMFLGTAHTFEEIDNALTRTDDAFAALARARKANAI